jgi:hypothetical protein
MAGENVLNYEEQGGSNWVIGGTLTILSGATIIPTGGTTPTLTSLVDNSGGTPSGTLAAITAGASYAQADMVAVKNAIADLAASVNAIVAAVKGIGVSL